MKKFFIVFFLMLGLATVTVLNSIDTSSFASGGCCKERKSTNSRWYPNGMAYNECDNLNRKIDRDYLIEPTGYIWWDEYCSN